MIGKRGDIELQFNWIFVIIVGTLILAIAAGFVLKQKQNSDQILSSQLITFTRSVITISSATPGKAEPQDLQKDLGLSCDPKLCTYQGCPSDIYVIPRTLNAKIDTKVEAIFSPATLKGTKLGTWSMEWDMPYHVYNFLYLSSDEVRYVFVKPDNYAEGVRMIQALYDEMPEIMGRKELVEWNEVEGLKKSGAYKVRLVFISETANGQLPFPKQLASMQPADLTAIWLIPDAGKGFELGTIKFYKKNTHSNGFEDQGSSDYLGEPTVFGAVFSDSKDFYDCNLQKALTRLSLVSQLYLGQLDTLNNDPYINPNCQTLYIGPTIEPNGVRGPIEQLANTGGLTASQVRDYADQIARGNTALKLKSCPQIY